MKYLASKDVVALGSTCQKMKLLSNSENVWFHFLKRDYGVEKDRVSDGKTTNKEVYKEEMHFERMLVSDPIFNNKPWDLENDLSRILLLSCKKGIMEAVKCCIRRGANLDQDDNLGWTTLMWASRNGHTPVVQLLLNKGADKDQVNNYGWTALMYASRNGHTPVVELLRNSGANIDQVDNDGYTALMGASSNGHTPVVELLLKSRADANIDHVDNYGLTALMYTSRNGHTHIVELLLKSGANRDHVGNNGWTALMRLSYEIFGFKGCGFTLQENK